MDLSETMQMLAMHLECFVPIEIIQLQRVGGPTDWHVEEALRKMATLREPGSSEALFFLDKGQTRFAVSVLVESLAVLAFVPGGVKAFGCHFEVIEAMKLLYGSLAPGKASKEEV